MEVAANIPSQPWSRQREYLDDRPWFGRRTSASDSGARRSPSSCKADYEPTAKVEYIGVETVAVTSYSSLFNTAPFFAPPGRNLRGARGQQCFWS